MTKLAASSAIALLVISCYMHACTAFSPASLSHTSPGLILNSKRLARNPSCNGFYYNKRVAKSSVMDMGDNQHLLPRQAKRKSLIFSLSVVAGCRRLSFLALSITLVKTFRTTVLKIPKSSKTMFDECPWPFTLFHDPKKFLKDGLTWTMIVWAGLCQIYGLIFKARTGSLPSKLFM